MSFGRGHPWEVVDHRMTNQFFYKDFATLVFYYKHASASGGHVLLYRNEITKIVKLELLPVTVQKVTNDLVLNTPSCM